MRTRILSVVALTLIALVVVSVLAFYSQRQDDVSIDYPATTASP